MPESPAPALHESETVEFKESFDREVVVSADALANTRGGTIFIGITDRGNVVGTLIGTESFKAWANTISQSTEPRIIPEIEELSRDGRAVAAIHIRENPLKPVSVRGRCYRRVGASNRAMQPHEIAEMHLQSVGRSWDLTPAPNTTFADLDTAKIADYIRKANETGRRNIAADESPQTVLQRIGLVDGNTPTWAALLLFGNDLQRSLSQATIHCGLFDADGISVLDDRMVRGTIIEQVNDAMEFIRKNIRVAFVMTGEPERKQVWDYPVEALREAVINAACHRDYTISSAVEIRILGDSLKIWSPGRLATGITLPELLTPHASVLRNKGIAQVLYDIGWIERWGGGIQKIRITSEAAGIPEPVFQEDQGFSVTFRKDVFDRNNLVRAGLSERQISAVLFAKETGKITNADYQKLADVSAATARRDLKGLVDRNIFAMKGVRKGIFYIIKPRQ
ncbi:MAG: helix-turn-helix domain-containing protein [Methanoregula sp.]|jgi:ATP-dependent DNA helicase RecG|uniref:AlbA family DNA-binding domain-containing protein n=1 Tax=Methanoregula sp. TaxID=2052170 RepID=UPI0025EABB6E|nr:helix-turn-helix domain-containing protein [Methanoregula sp.]MCK9630422.1 helix-turn-helix domain-containing protein [Methanoregula sp.]